MKYTQIDIAERTVELQIKQAERQKKWSIQHGELDHASHIDHYLSGLNAALAIIKSAKGQNVEKGN